jgi:hypothetical protein
MALIVLMASACFTRMARRARAALERTQSRSIGFRHLGDQHMGWHRVLAAIAFGLVPATVGAGSTEWRRYAIPSTGASVDIPVTIFSEDAGVPEDGVGRRFLTSDHRADLTVKSVLNSENDSPAAFLSKMRPPASIQYKRVTPRFFAVSSIRNGRTWYNRCNRSRGYMNCVLINYPAAEERQWDAVVTRISLSLAN